MDCPLLISLYSSLHEYAPHKQAPNNIHKLILIIKTTFPGAGEYTHTLSRPIRCQMHFPCFPPTIQICGSKSENPSKSFESISVAEAFWHALELDLVCPQVAHHRQPRPRTPIEDNINWSWHISATKSPNIAPRLWVGRGGAQAQRWEMNLN